MSWLGVCRSNKTYYICLFLCSGFIYCHQFSSSPCPLLFLLFCSFLHDIVLLILLLFFMIIFFFISLFGWVYEHIGVHAIMSLETTVEWLGGICIRNWYLYSLSMSHFNSSASITEYWHGMMSVLVDFFFWMSQRTYWCPCHCEFRNYSWVGWWYTRTHLQLVFGQFEYVPLQF